MDNTFIAVELKLWKGGYLFNDAISRNTQNHTQSWKTGCVWFNLWNHYAIFSDNFHSVVLWHFNLICNFRRDYKATLRFIEYARQEYELAAQYAQCFENKDFFLVDISLLNEDISFLKRSSDSINLREQADILFDTYVMQSEELDFENVWNILDMYKAAEIHSRNIDIENEAIAISRQGRIFYRILKLQSKAHTYYRASFDLAATLYPRDMNNCDWFKECKIVLEELQKAKVKKEEAEKEKERAPYLEKMKGVLDALKAHS